MLHFIRRHRLAIAAPAFLLMAIFGGSRVFAGSFLALPEYAIRYVSGSSMPPNCTSGRQCSWVDAATTPNYRYYDGTNNNYVSACLPTTTGDVCSWNTSTGTWQRTGGGSTGNWTFSGNNADLTGAGAMGLGLTTATGLTLGPASWTVAANLVLNGANSATNTIGMKLVPNVADGASSIAAVINNATTLVTAGAKLLSLQNHGTEELFFDKGGTIGSANANILIQSTNMNGSTQMQSPSGLGKIFVDDASTGAELAYSGNNITVGSSVIAVAGNVTMLPAASISNASQGATNTIGLSVKPNVADGASSIALSINNQTTLSTGGAKLLSLKNNGTEETFFDLGGNLNIGGGGATLNFSSGTGSTTLGTSTSQLRLSSTSEIFFVAHADPIADNTYRAGSNGERWSGVGSYWYDTKLGAQLTAASTITPTCGLHHVTGATTINIIATTNVPASGNVTIILIADSAITFGSSASAGGIKIAPTSLASGKAMIFALDSSTSLWYPVQGG